MGGKKKQLEKDLLSMKDSQLKTYLMERKIEFKTTTATASHQGRLCSGVVAKIVLPRWQKGVRARGAFLGCMVWATPRVLASKIFRFFLLLMLKAMCCG